MSLRILAVMVCLLFASAGFAQGSGQGIAQGPGQGIAQGSGQGIAQGPGQGIAQGSGQGTAQRSWRFRSDNYGGIAIGELGSYGQVETVNGVYKGPWFIGLGTGLDFYRFRTVPLYLSVTRDLFWVAKSGAFFLNLNGGIILPWFASYPQPIGMESSKFFTGLLWTGGLGYRQQLSAKTDKALLFSFSYEAKKLIEHQKGSPCIGCMYPSENPPSYDYDYVNRVFLLNIGFQF